MTIERKTKKHLKINGLMYGLSLGHGVKHFGQGALLLISPTLEKGLELEIIGKLVSKPYISMTLNLMKKFGVHHLWEDNIISIKNQKYIGKDYEVEDGDVIYFKFNV